MNDSAQGSLARRLLRSLGPAIIVASVVLGPGSILTSSKVGCLYGYDLVWLLVGASVLMIGMVALAARVGVTLDRTPCEELAARLGRPVAALVGLTLFLVAASFQSSNNIAVIAALEPMLQAETATGPPSTTLPAVCVMVLNAVVIAAMYGFRNLYKPLEKLMMVLVGLMILGFVGNLVFARPSLAETLAGLAPRLPEGVGGRFLPYREGGEIVDPWWAVQGLIGTTFSVGGAFYQAYLVREKGWTRRQLPQGLIDSIAGISVLGGVTLVIMLTAAATLHGRVAPEALRSTTDVAQALAPLFGESAKVLFTLGIFAGAFSSFLVNSMIGGALLSDGLGLGGRMDQPWPKAFTVAGLLIGMAVALAATSFGIDRVPLIIFAQALTVAGVPVLALALLYLAVKSPAPTPNWLLALAVSGTLLMILLAVRTGWRIFLQVT